MTPEQVQSRKVELERNLVQAQANVHAIQGAIQDCDYWLVQMAKEAADEQGKQ